jgi:hypothetical protein
MDFRTCFTSYFRVPAINQDMHSALIVDQYFSLLFQDAVQSTRSTQPKQLAACFQLGSNTMASATEARAEVQEAGAQQPAATACQQGGQHGSV